MPVSFENVTDNGPTISEQRQLTDELLEELCSVTPQPNAGGTPVHPMRP